MHASSSQPAGGALHVESSRNGTVIFSLRGRLDAHTVGSMWRDTARTFHQSQPPHLIVDGSAIDYCDGSGIAFLMELRRRQLEAGRTFELRRLPVEVEQLTHLYGDTPPVFPSLPATAPLSMVEYVGRGSVRTWHTFQRLVAFIGELTVVLMHALRHPASVRWRDALTTAERAGSDAVPIVGLLGFLLGLIMAFQAAIPMRQFGTEIYVANLIGLSMLRELGPLLTAIILAGRSGSAFAAEIGTMKVKEEIDALVTMGLDPVRFLVLPRVIAAVAVTPILAVFADLFGLVGGAVVMRSLGFPLITYVHQIQAQVVPRDVIGGLVKAVVFGLVVAAIGCLRGLQTRTGASAVGDSTTNAVVSGLILITIVDGVFAVVFYYLGI